MGLFTVKCRKCGEEISKRSTFCRHCGTPTPGGWVKCPGCGKWVGNDSEHCWNCNTRLHPGERASMAGGVWQKTPEVFAQRFEVGDLKLGAGNAVQVQEGTAAILLEAGAVGGVLEAGRHGVDGTLRKINWFGAPPPRSVVLIDAGEVIVPLRVENLRTAEGFPLDFYGEVAFRFAGGKDAARAFVANVLKGGRETRMEELSARAAPLVSEAVDKLCTTSTLEDLVKDPERRARLRQDMTDRLAEDFGASGLEVVRVGRAEFGGEAYEELEKARGEWEIARREAERAAELRKLKADVEMGRFKSETDLREYKEILDAESRASAAQRESEWKELQAALAHAAAVAEAGRKAEREKAEAEADAAARARRHEGERAETVHEIDLDALKGGHARDAKIADARTEVEIAKMKADEEFRQTQEALRQREEKQRIHQAGKAADAERRKGMSETELVADVDDPAARDAVLEAQRIQAQQEKTAEQLLAEQGIDPKANTQMVAKVEEMTRDALDRMERLAGRALDAANEAAKRPADGGNTIVK